jgi:hypothetical protein
MRSYRLPVAALAMSCCVLVACGDDKPAASGASTAGTSSAAAAATGGTSATSSASDSSSAGAIGSGDLDCAALKTTLAGLSANWQVVVGTLPHAPTSDWDDVPLGNISEFGNQIDTANAALGKNSQAAGALTYMSAANDIVVRGVGGDETAQADLTDYLGPDANASVNKQIPIALAFQNAGCS